MISVLVVDDDNIVRERLADFLIALGHSVQTAASAAEGLAAAVANAPDIALLDIRLPDASGLALFEAFRAEDPDLGIIMLTGRSDVPTAVRSMQNGALGIVEKPIDLELLQASVLRAAELVGLRREVARLRQSASDLSDLSLATAERLAISRALEKVDGNRVRAASLLGIARSTLQEKLRRSDAN
jgi:DNA-binding NtrC family response regulator